MNIKQLIKKQKRPIRVVQFGEGNFLRAFVDYMLDAANESGVFNADAAVVKPIPHGSLESFREQDNLYTVILRGRSGGELVNESRIISCIQKVVDCYENFDEFLSLAEIDTLEFIVSNTTEAGIAFDSGDKLGDRPAGSFPAKLTQLLYYRYTYYKGAADKGLIILPVELIEDNGKKLAGCVRRYAELWELESEFINWLDETCVFCSTLVDRIVTGFPGDEAEELCRTLGYNDKLLDVAEPFGLWVIESDRPVKHRLPLDKCGMPVIFTDNLRPYRERKVRILNGAHTSVMAAAYLCGQDFVGGCMADPLIRRYLEKLVREEIAPCLTLPRNEIEEFITSVFERFENPFINHALLSISLNSVSKWAARVLPSLKAYFENNGSLPECLVFSFAALLAFYTGNFDENKYYGTRGGELYEINDDAAVLELFDKAGKLSAEEYTVKIASDSALWGEDLTEITEFAARAAQYLNNIRERGAAAALLSLISK